MLKNISTGLKDCFSIILRAERKDNLLKTAIAQPNFRRRRCDIKSDIAGRQNQISRANRVILMGVGIDCLSSKELYSRVQSLLSDDKKHLITYVNIHTMNIAYKNASLREAYFKSTVTYCDGAGIKLGARIAGKYIPERMTSATFIHDFCKRWENDGVRIFFLGGLPGVATKACHLLRQLYPRLQIVGEMHGYFKWDCAEEEGVLLKISDAHPDILFIGFGTPLQELWTLAKWDRLHAHIVWPIGAVVDYLACRVPRCPKWMEENSLEWLFRLIYEPKRMFRRYVIGNPLFLFRILCERLHQT
jgi:N-acetylglucosaminyldiphosphoundecaprenol N-acetyl-beta-D-mannosaminyltransferase